jgi:hypothetical protein
MLRYEKIMQTKKGPRPDPSKIDYRKICRGRTDGENDPIRGIIGMGSGDGAPNTRNHDEILYDSAKSKLKSKSPQKE